MLKKEKMMSGTPQSVLIAEEQILAAGEVLARAFFNDPLSVYTQPDLEARLNVGLSPQEIEEIIIHTVSYAGFPTAINAMRLLQEVLEETAQPPASAEGSGQAVAEPLAGR
jgi:hypothetical protein